jgi:2-polyprenyl-3-methyl-5-hydroxy-6-metoxy-1,4-benzoquinol methylase
MDSRSCSEKKNNNHTSITRGNRRESSCIIILAIYRISGNCAMEVICPLCNSSQLSILIRHANIADKTYNVFFCEMCNVGITIPNPSPSELSSLYSTGTYRAASGNRFVGFVEKGVYLARQLRRKRIEKYKRNGRILDIGCGRGVFLNVMKKNGWTVAGTEYDQITAESIAEYYNINVATGNPGDWRFPPGSFDVITMNHVLEHMPDPGIAIDECSRLLVKGGLLVVAVPNITSLQSSLGKQLWFHLDIPYHLYHFSEEGLANLLKKYNYRLLKIRRFDFEYNPFGWLQTLLNLTGIRKNLFYDLLKGTNSKINIISNASKWDLLATIFLLPLYLPMSLVLSLYESFLLKKGGTIEIYAVKM